MEFGWTEYGWVNYLVFAVLYLVAQVYENYYRDKERGEHVELIAKQYGTIWHTAQYAGWIVAFVTIALVTMELGTAAKVLAVSAAVWWIGYDGWLNKLKGRGFWYRSPHSSSTFEKIAFPWVKIGLLILVLGMVFFAGCTPAVRYIDRVTVDTIRVVPPVIKDSIKVVEYDTVIVAQRIVEKDTVIDVKYYPKEKFITVKVKPDTVEVLRVDTVTQVQVIEKAEDEIAWYEQWWIWAIGVVVLVVMILRKKG